MTKEFIYWQVDIEEPNSTERILFKEKQDADAYILANYPDYTIGYTNGIYDRWDEEDGDSEIWVVKIVLPIEYPNPPLIKDVLNLALKDDKTPYGGTASMEETLSDFMNSISFTYEDTDTVERINPHLIECGILPVTQDNYDI